MQQVRVQGSCKSLIGIPSRLVLPCTISLQVKGLGVFGGEEIDSCGVLGLVVRRLVLTGVVPMEVV